MHPNINTMAFERRCISPCRVVRRRNCAAMTPPRALPTERITTLGASSYLWSGALGVVPQGKHRPASTSTLCSSRSS